VQRNVRIYPVSVLLSVHCHMQHVCDRSYVVVYKDPMLTAPFLVRGERRGGVFAVPILSPFTFKSLQPRRRGNIIVHYQPINGPTAGFQAFLITNKKNFLCFEIIHTYNP
jgi:hypothetical protein